MLTNACVLGGQGKTKSKCSLRSDFVDNRSWVCPCNMVFEGMSYQGQVPVASGSCALPSPQSVHSLLLDKLSRIPNRRNVQIPVHQPIPRWITEQFCFTPPRSIHTHASHTPAHDTIRCIGRYHLLCTGGVPMAQVQEKNEVTP